MKLLMLFANDFEDTEAIGTLDVLLRGGDEVTCASLMDSVNVRTKCGNILTVSTLLKNCNLSSFDGLIIPGGPGSFKIMPNIKEVDETIKYFADNKKLIAAICAAPHLIGKLGYYKDKNYTVFPRFEDKIIGGNYKRDKGVVVDGNFITAKSMFYSLEFGFTIHEYFHGKESKEKLILRCQGE